MDLNLDMAEGSLDKGLILGECKNFDFFSNNPLLKNQIRKKF